MIARQSDLVGALRRDGGRRREVAEEEVPAAVEIRHGRLVDDIVRVAADQALIGLGIGPDITALIVLDVRIPDEPQGIVCMERREQQDLVVPVCSHGVPRGELGRMRVFACARHLSDSPVLARPARDLSDGHVATQLENSRIAGLRDDGDLLTDLQGKADRVLLIDRD